MRDDTIFDPLDAYLLAESTKPQRPYNAFYPSDASCEVQGKIIGRCLRYQFWRWNNEPFAEPMTYRSWISMVFGAAYDDAFMKAYRACGLLKGAEVPFRVHVMGLNIHGRIDGLTKNNIILECKTAYGWKFNKELATEADENNLVQIMLYMGILGMDTCCLAYGSRDNTGTRVGHRLRKRDIEAKGILLIKILIRWKKLQDFIKTGILPPRDFDINKNWQCRYCVYMNKCYSRQELNDYFYKAKPSKAKKATKLSPEAKEFLVQSISEL